MNKHSAFPYCSWAPLSGNRVFFFLTSVVCSEGQRGQRAIYKHKISDSGAKHRSADPPRHEGYAIKIKRGMLEFISILSLASVSLWISLCLSVSALSIFLYLAYNLSISKSCHSLMISNLKVINQLPSSFSL